MARQHHGPAGRGAARNDTAGASGPTQRQLRVGELVRHALADVLMRGDLHAPEIAGTIVTVSEVRTSTDLRHATVFVAPLGGGDTAPVVAAMRKAKGFLRSRVARAVNLKYAPELHFEGDTSFDYAEKMNRVMKQPKVAADIARTDDPDDPVPGETGRDGDV